MAQAQLNHGEGPPRAGRSRGPERAAGDARGRAPCDVPKPEVEVDPGKGRSLIVVGVMAGPECRQDADATAARAAENVADSQEVRGFRFVAVVVEALAHGVP
jgi:hypothetical protein